MNIILTCFLALTLFIPSVEAKIKLNGEINLNGGTFPEKETSNAFDFEASFTYKKTIGKHLGLSFTPHLHYNRFKDSNGNHFFLRTENTGLFYKKNDFYFSTGFLSHKFGLTEGLSPINFIDTFYYTNPIESPSIASPTIRFMYKTKKWRAFISYFPYRFENVYPGNNSPWIPRKAPSSLITDIDPEFLPNGVTAEEAEILFPEELEFSFNNSVEQDDALKNNIAIGLRYEGEIISSQIVAYNGLDTNANLQPSLTLLTEDLSSDPVRLRLDGNQIGVTPTNERISRLGFGFKYVTPIKWRLFYEGSLSNGESDTGQQTEFRQTHTAGLEWGIPVGDTLILGVLQAYYSKSSNESRLGLVSPLNEAYIFGAIWNNDKIELNSTYLRSESLSINLINIGIGYKFSKKFKVNLSGSLLSGNVSELLSGIIDSDYVNLKLTQSF